MTSMCAPCADGCSTCTEYPACTSCSSDPNRVTFAKPNDIYCFCNLGFYSANPADCGSCKDGCATCDDGTTCTRCMEDAGRVTFADGATDCLCKDGFF